LRLRKSRMKEQGEKKGGNTFQENNLERGEEK
jgi:hypothetical protein